MAQKTNKAAKPSISDSSIDQVENSSSAKVKATTKKVAKEDITIKSKNADTLPVSESETETLKTKKTNSKATNTEPVLKNKSDKKASMEADSETKNISTSTNNIKSVSKTTTKATIEEIEEPIIKTKSKTAEKKEANAEHTKDSEKPVKTPKKSETAKPTAPAKKMPVSSIPVKQMPVLPRPVATPVRVSTEKKPIIVVAHRRMDTKLKMPEESQNTMVSYQPDTYRSILDNVEQQHGPVYRYSDEELAEFKELITSRLEAARKELNYLQGLITRKEEAGTEDTDNRYMNMDDGSGAMEREQLSQLAGRQIQFTGNLEKALMRIENKTYGICRVTGKLIDKARLRAVPHATLSIEAKKGMAK